MTLPTDPHETASRRSPATWAVLAAAAAVTLLLAVPAVLALLRASGVLEVDVEQSVRDRTVLVGVANTESGLRIAEGWLAFLTLPVAVVSLVLTVGLARLRPWAREGAIGVYGLGGALIALLSVHGLLQDPPGRNSLEGLLAGLAITGIAGLLLTPACCLDVDRAEARQRVAAMRAAAAERRARESPGARPQR